MLINRGEGKSLKNSEDFPGVPRPVTGPSDVIDFLPAGEEPSFEPSPRIWRLSLVLFLLTCCSTFYIGMTAYGGIRVVQLVTVLVQGHPHRAQIFKTALWGGLSYAGPLMSILLAHEFGHYLQARRYRVPAIPPLFIPMPFPPFGTMGAVIVQSPHHADRKAMFDIAISGPLAGLVLALPVAWLGIRQSRIAEFNPQHAVQVFGDPLVLKWMIQAVHGPLGPNHDVVVNPLLMAGWVGVFITALNLMPIGQLDGGHLLYCLLGRRAHFVAIALVGVIVAYMAYSKYWAFSVMVILLLVMGVKHPPTTNDSVPLGPVRVVLGWLTLAFVLVGITPRPLDIRLPSVPPAAVSGLNRGWTGLSSIGFSRVSPGGRQNVAQGVSPGNLAAR